MRALYAGKSLTAKDSKEEVNAAAQPQAPAKASFQPAAPSKATAAPKATSYVRK
jgi:hypothetical protein